MTPEFNNPLEFNEMTAEQARAELETLKSDNGFLQKYTDGVPSAVQRMTDLYRAAHRTDHLGMPESQGPSESELEIQEARKRLKAAYLDTEFMAAYQDPMHISHQAAVDHMASLYQLAHPEGV